MITRARWSALGLASVAVLATGCGGGDDGGGTEEVSLPASGVSVQRPGGWKSTTDEASINLTGPGERVSLNISSVPGREPKALKAAVTTRIAEEYAPARLLGKARKAKLGERTAVGFQMQGTRQGGIPVDVAVFIEDTSFRTYSVIATTYSGEQKPPQEDLDALGAAVRSIVLSEPDRGAETGT